METMKSFFAILQRGKRQSAKAVLQGCRQGRLRRHFAAVLCLLLILPGLLLTPFLLHAEEAATPVPEALSGLPEIPANTIRLGWLERSQINPLNTFDPSGEALMHLLYRGLFRIDQEEMLRTDLAQEASWSADHLRLHIRLRADVSFSNGAPLHSVDAALSILWRGAYLLRSTARNEDGETAGEDIPLAYINPQDLIFDEDTSEPLAETAEDEDNKVTVLLPQAAWDYRSTSGADPHGTTAYAAIEKIGLRGEQELTIYLREVCERLPWYLCDPIVPGKEVTSDDMTVLPGIGPFRLEALPRTVPGEEGQPVETTEAAAETQTTAETQAAAEETSASASQESDVSGASGESDAEKKKEVLDPLRQAFRLMPVAAAGRTGLQYELYPYADIHAAREAFTAGKLDILYLDEEDFASYALRKDLRSVAMETLRYHFWLAGHKPRFLFADSRLREKLWQLLANAAWNSEFDPAPFPHHLEDWRRRYLPVSSLGLAADLEAELRTALDGQTIYLVAEAGREGRLQAKNLQRLLARFGAQIQCSWIVPEQRREVLEEGAFDFLLCEAELALPTDPLTLSQELREQGYTPGIAIPAMLSDPYPDPAFIFRWDLPEEDLPTAQLTDSYAIYAASLTRSALLPIGFSRTGLILGPRLAGTMRAVYGDPYQDLARLRLNDGER